MGAIGDQFDRPLALCVMFGKTYQIYVGKTLFRIIRKHCLSNAPCVLGGTRVADDKVCEIE